MEKSTSFDKIKEKEKPWICFELNHDLSNTCACVIVLAVCVLSDIIYNNEMGRCS